MKVKINIPRKDLRREVFRAGGPGGQAQNKTSSAVRWVHIPTGIMCASRSDRSQHANSKIAMDGLMEKLTAFALLKRGVRPRRPPATFGMWKRCYRLVGREQDVQDIETEVVEPNTRKVLDGGIDRFIEAAMRERMMGEGSWRAEEND